MGKSFNGKGSWSKWKKGGKSASKEKKRSELRFQIWGDANICSQYEYDDYEDQENEEDESILWESSEHDIFWWDNYNKSNDCDDNSTDKLIAFCLYGCYLLGWSCPSDLHPSDDTDEGISDIEEDKMTKEVKWSKTKDIREYFRNDSSDENYMVPVSSDDETNSTSIIFSDREWLTSPRPDWMCVSPGWFADQDWEDKSSEPPIKRKKSNEEKSERGNDSPPNPDDLELIFPDRWIDSPPSPPISDYLEDEPHESTASSSSHSSVSIWMSDLIDYDYDYPIGSRGSYSPISENFDDEKKNEEEKPENFDDEKKNEEEKPKYDLLFNPSPEFLKKVEENEDKIKHFESFKDYENDKHELLSCSSYTNELLSCPSPEMDYLKSIGIKLDEANKYRDDDEKIFHIQHKPLTSSLFGKTIGENDGRGWVENPLPTEYEKVNLWPIASGHLSPLALDFAALHKTMNRNIVLEKMKEEYQMNVSNGFLTPEDYLEISSTFYYYIANNIQMMHHI